MGNYFADFSSASGGFAPDPHRGSAPGPRWGTSVLQTPWFAPNPCCLATPLFVVMHSGLQAFRAVPLTATRPAVLNYIYIFIRDKKPQHILQKWKQKNIKVAYYINRLSLYFQIHT